MRGVYFSDYHTNNDWGLILNSKQLDPPTPKVVKVSVDGRDGDLDLSEALTGEIRYENRIANFTFLVTEGSQGDREYMLNTIINAIHGKTHKIILPDDLEHYLIGRCSVSGVTNDKAYGSFSVSADCEPYRYSIYEVKRTIELTDTPVEIALNNSGRKTIIPTLVVANTANITFGSTSLSLGVGTYQIPALKLTSGVNTVLVSGVGSLALSYREAVL